MGLLQRLLGLFLGRPTPTPASGPGVLDVPASPGPASPVVPRRDPATSPPEPMHEVAPVAAEPGPGVAPEPGPEIATGEPPRPDKSKLAHPGADEPAGGFLPITRGEILAAARGRSLLANVWFGMRDRIPPADDPRTNLIDRALVTEGLLTPEQLAEIHAAGAEMERVRPSLAGVTHRAGITAEAALEARRAERVALKDRKRAEAAERRRLHEEAVAHRRATDIVFLGAGVSKGLTDREGNRAALEALGLPVLFTPAELAEALDLTIPRLRWLAFHTEVATRVHYVRFEIPKRSGGTRVLHAPHRTLATAQRWIFDEILHKLPVHDAAHGFVTGRGTPSNAAPHAGRAVVVNCDLCDFFPSIHWPRVRAVFQRLGYSPAVATILALLCTECPRSAVTYDGTPYLVATGPRGLPQGACTSPALSNQVAVRLDRRFSGLATRLGLTYTRYADDLTFSGAADLESRVGYLLARIRHIAADEGFAVNEAKTRVLRRNTAQTVTGLVVNDRPRPPRSELRQLRAILHRAAREGLAAQHREGRPDIRAWLLGKIAYVAMTDPALGARLRAQFDALPETG